VPQTIERNGLHVDFEQTVGIIRPLHGVNRGPLTTWGLVDLSKEFRMLRIPSVRLHDCPQRFMDSVDVHLIFPDFTADPDDPANYRFTNTDAYIEAIMNIGAEVVFRLGETIEHYRNKSYVNPPVDHVKWGRICANIVRHYNQGWANGFHYGIRYWEIWNEPNVRPQCWTGTNEEFTSLYVTASKIVKAVDPKIKVGGPGFGGTIREEPWFPEFLQACAEQGAPLDFLSWHCYTSRPNFLLQSIQFVRDMLDQHGFLETENHLNEWNYLPGDNWALIWGPDYNLRSRTSERQRGIEGAAFIASAFCLFQDSKLDVGNFYTGDVLNWGLFEQCGARFPNFYAFLAFAELLETPVRVKTQGDDPEAGLALCAGISEDGSRAQILMANLCGTAPVQSLTIKGLPWKDRVSCEIFVLEEQRGLVLLKTQSLATPEAVLEIELPSPSVCLMKLTS
jgi:hypothetical protein